MKISIGADHRGYALKAAIIKHFASIDWLDVGADNDQRSDYPRYAAAVTRAVLEKRVQAGVLLCGSGIGMSIAANRHKGIYAGLCWSPAVATVAKENDGINVLVLPASSLQATEAFAIIHAWLDARFKDGRHQDRLAMIDKT
jgi:ribose 5-phosphate isomerase B